MVRRWHFLTLLLMALDLGMSFAHTLEWIPKSRYDSALYIRLQNSLDVGFGTLGAVIDVLTPILLVVLAIMVRHRRSERTSAFVAAGCFILAFVLWVIFIAPVNSAFAAAAPTAPPPNWEALRSQWEITHAARFVLDLIGFGALLWHVTFRQPEPA